MGRKLTTLRIRGKIQLVGEAAARRQTRSAMNRSVTVTYSLPEEVCVILEQKAAAENRRWEDVVAEHVAKCRPERRSLTPEEVRLAREAFERDFGTFDSGDPNFSDNDRIDADLAKEYGGRDA
jgi:hypothetical protein